jgi:fucose permease
MNRKLINALFCSMMVHFSMALTIISPLLLEIGKTYSLSMAELGWVFTYSFLGFVVFVFAAGFVAEKIGKKAVIVISLAGVSISLFLVMFAGSFGWFCFFMFFIGGFGGTVEAIMVSAVPDVNEEHVSFHQNLIQIFFGVGALVGPVGAGLLVTSGLDWKLCFTILGAFGVVILILFAFTPMPDKRPKGGFSFKELTDLMRDWKYLLICLCIFFYTGAEIGAWGWLSTFLKQNLGFSLTKGSLAVGVFWIAMTVGRIICGGLTLRFKTSRIVMVLAYAASAATVSALFISAEALVWIQVALMGLTFSSIWPLAVNYGGEQRGSNSSIVFSVLVGSGAIGAMIIPNLMGLLGSVTDAKLPMLLPAFALLFIGVFFSVAGNKR